MKIQTTRFGEVEVNEDSVFEFVLPIVGYNDENKFTIIEHDAESAFKWLQSTKTPDLAFAITAPAFFGIDYSFELPDHSQEVLGIETAADVLSLNIVVIPQGNPINSTINLLAPIVFNTRLHRAGQVILAGTDFDVSYPLLKNKGGV